jgi:hypothetical protein
MHLLVDRLMPLLASSTSGSPHSEAADASSARRATVYGIRLSDRTGRFEKSWAKYSRTAAWGQALYDHADYDGLVWRSRQFNDSYALMLWGRRVDRFNDLDPDPTNAPLPLYAGTGFDEVQQLADKCDITVIG